MEQEIFLTSAVLAVEQDYIPLDYDDIATNFSLPNSKKWHLKLQ